MKQIITYKDITLEDVTLNQAQNTLRPKMELGEFFTVRREGRTPRKGRVEPLVKDVPQARYRRTTLRYWYANTARSATSS
jgi:hypothetical protein